MKEYIEREAAIQLVRTEGFSEAYDLGSRRDNRYFCDELMRIPAADVVEVVRCRDCDIGMCYSDDSVQCEWSNGFYADDYCPRGKRKGGDE